MKIKSSNKIILFGFISNSVTTHAIACYSVWILMKLNLFKSTFMFVKTSFIAGMDSSIVDILKGMEN
jgi:hypothetical protein